MPHITIDDEDVEVRYAVGASSTGPFAFNFAAFAESDLKVYVDGELLTLTTDYTVSLTGGFTGGYPGGTITLVDAVADADVFIVRDIPIARTTDLPESGGPLFPRSLNTDFDRTFGVLQQLKRIVERTIRLEEWEASADLELPDADARANKALIFDEDGDVTVSTDDYEDQVATVAASAAEAAASEASASASAASATASESAADASADAAALSAASITRYFNVMEYGAIGDGVVDDVLFIQEAADSAAAVGGGDVYFPPGTYKISQTIQIATGNVRLVGSGGYESHDGGTGASPVSEIVWHGASGGTMLAIFTSSGIANSRRTGFGVRDLYLNGNLGLADIGIDIISISNSEFRGVHVENVADKAYHLRCWTSEVDLAEAADIQRCYFERCTFRLIDVAAVQNAHGFYFDGSANANTSFNTFVHCGGRVHDGVGLYFNNADNNTFLGSAIFNNNSTATGWCVYFAGWDANRFIGLSASGPRGIKIGGTASGHATNSLTNVFLGLDTGNGTLFPTMDAGCRAVVLTDSGYLFQTDHVNAGFGNSDGAAIAARAAKPTSATAYFYNDTGDGTRWGDGTTEYTVRINGNNFQVLQTDGTTGVVELPALSLADTPLPVDSGGTGDTGTAWAAYVPTVSATTGTITTSSATGRWKTIGKTVFFRVEVTITTNGTGADGVLASLPVDAEVTSYVGGVETAPTHGDLLSAYLDGPNMLISKEGGTHPAIDGSVLLIQGSYESESV